MSPNSGDSMLEAFKDARGKSDVGGPFAGPPLAAVAQRTKSARGPVVALAASGVAFLLGVLVGRGTAGLGEDAALAAESDGELEESSFADQLDALKAAPPPPAAATTPPGSADPSGVAALYDPKNKYTIVAISVTRSNETIAWQNYDHLRANGLPAFPPFETANGMLAIVVGAAPKESDLAEWRNRLRRLAGPDGVGQPYEGAYTNPIRKLLPTAPGD